MKWIIWALILMTQMHYISMTYLESRKRKVGAV